MKALWLPLAALLLSACTRRSPDEAGTAKAMSAAAGAQLTEQELPAAVAEALRVNYEIGRHKWDSGGISILRLFAVEGATDIGLAALVEQVVRLDNEPPPGTDPEAYKQGNLMEGCAQTMDDEAVTPEACARHLFDPNAGRRPNIYAFYSPAQKATCPAKALTTAATDEDKVSVSTDILRCFLWERVGRDFLEMSTNANVWSVDVSSVILLSADKKTLALVRYDYGA